jgi:hypothetical protein
LPDAVGVPIFIPLLVLWLAGCPGFPVLHFYRCAHHGVCFFFEIRLRITHRKIRAELAWRFDNTECSFVAVLVDRMFVLLAPFSFCINSSELLFFLKFEIAFFFFSV